MFGLENQKKKKKLEPFIFELEKELKDTVKQRQLTTLVEKRVARIKEHLTTGEVKEEFDRIGILLHGYTSLMKVMARCQSQNKKI